MRGGGGLSRNRCDVIVVGPSGSGKTSLIRGLRRKAFDIQEPQTVGISRTRIALRPSQRAADGADEPAAAGSPPLRDRRGSRHPELDAASLAALGGTTSASRDLDGISPQSEQSLQLSMSEHDMMPPTPSRGSRGHDLGDLGTSGGGSDGADHAVIWDVAGDEAFLPMPDAQQRRFRSTGARLALVVFDATDAESFEDAVCNWLPRMRDAFTLGGGSSLSSSSGMYEARAPSESQQLTCQIVLVGNKADLPGVKQELLAGASRVLRDSRSGAVDFVLVSAKNGFDADELLGPLHVAVDESAYSPRNVVSSAAAGVGATTWIAPRTTVASSEEPEVASPMSPRGRPRDDTGRAGLARPSNTVAAPPREAELSSQSSSSPPNVTRVSTAASLSPVSEDGPAFAPLRVAPTTTSSPPPVVVRSTAPETSPVSQVEKNTPNAPKRATFGVDDVVKLLPLVVASTAAAVLVSISVTLIRGTMVAGVGVASR